MKKYLLAVLSIVLALSVADAHFGSRGPYGGSVSCMISHDSTVYVGTSNGGVFESTNASLVAWRARPVGLKQGKITALAHTGKFLFAATADSGVFCFNGFDAKDRYWTPANKGIVGKKITCMIALDSNSLMVGTFGDGLYLSNDLGASWKSVNNDVLHHYEILGLVKIGDRIIHTSLDGGVWASKDLGSSWEDYNDDNTYHIDGECIISNASSDGQIMVSNANGIFTTNTLNDVEFPEYTNVLRGEAIGKTIYSISNDESNWYLLTDKGILRSPKNSISWTFINTGLTTIETKALVAFGDNLVCGTLAEGIFKASNTSTPTWSKINVGFNNLETYSMIASDNLLVAATSQGVFVNTAVLTAIAYNKRNFGLTDSLNVNDLAFGGTRLFAATKHLGVFQSVDSAKTWANVSLGLSNMNIKKIFCDVKNQMKYCICSSGNIYKSGLTSNEWQLFTSGFIGKASSLTFQDKNVIATTLTNGVQVSKNGGDWIMSTMGLTNLITTSITTNGADIYVGTTGSGVFVTDSSTMVWSPVVASPTNKYTGFVNNAYNSLNIQAMHSNAGWVFASYKGGVFATSDRGVTWVPAGNQFNYPTFSNVFKIGIGTDRIFVTTDNNSLYSNGLAELPALNAIEEKRTVNDVFSVYPNPSNGAVRVDFSEKGVSELSVYNALGIVLESIKPTSTSILLQLEKGIYIIKGVTNTTSFTEKIIVE